MKNTFLITAALCLLSLGNVARANSIRVDFTATVDVVFEFHDAFGGTLDAGDTVSGSIIYDLSTEPRTGPNTPTADHTEFRDAISLFRIDNYAQVDDISLNNITHNLNHLGGFEQIVYSNTGTDAGSGLFESMEMNLAGADLFADINQLDGNPDFSSLTFSTFRYGIQNNPGGFISGSEFRGTVGSFSISAIPLPATHWLLALCLVTLLFFRTQGPAVALPAA